MGNDITKFCGCTNNLSNLNETKVHIHIHTYIINIVNERKFRTIWNKFKQPKQSFR